MLIHGLVLCDEFVEVDGLISYILRALLVRLKAKGVSAPNHVHWAETEA